FHMMGALAQFERDLIRERTMAGLKAARERGNVGGRPRKLKDADLKFARSLMRDKERALVVARCRYSTWCVAHDAVARDEAWPCGPSLGQQNYDWARSAT